MPERRRFTQTEPLEKQLTAEAARLRKDEALRRASSAIALFAEPAKQRQLLTCPSGWPQASYKRQDKFN